MADTFKFRIDHHGSLVRPPELLAARAASSDDLRDIEDAAIAEAVRRQRKLSLTVVTDGEFRRADLRSAVFDAVHGFKRADSSKSADSSRSTDGSKRAGSESWIAEGELKPYRSLVADDVAAIATLTQIPAKATLPSPAYLAATTFQPGGAWASARELGEFLAPLIRDEIQAIISRGVRLIQIDNHGYAQSLFSDREGSLTFDDALAVDALAVTIADKPFNVRIGLCPLTRAGGELNVAAAEKLFTTIPVDRWVLPYDTGAPAEAQLLRAVPSGRDVCLGIVSPLTPQLEDVDTVMDRMDHAATIRDLEDIAISPSAGFSELAGHPTISAEDQWRKLTHVETFARMCWGNEL
ncbi:5-methyltetrahydropteroyltriglutamate--homocysteine methyltransferase [Actinoplanes lutulentus]|uniref:5-methyltetrahydropteroyltriglutamate--homocysteine methyltransferase n=1 Tax=Actinoplanes lutulentus TaxID=1287878 RepID=A0A327ZJK5_9ACTN|nr:methionine synthase II (cobalamin-independent)-like protein [Actinoplanes lutulentus]MBB2943934.1 5-methyltetrahydropteroyltriglutamate--homocysteine methyltransferase [Actinoplanes lutulentus]RAK42833.1 5-methyltetrahydropteroyltriglutamate--homocysteine methyltransferase [Actinoplanes lutulentus]